jgi:hypothetical protein
MKQIKKYKKISTERLYKLMFESRRKSIDIEKELKKRLNKK